MNFENKVVIVTGSASGMGVTEAEAFAKAGAKVVIADLNEEGAKQISEKIRSEGGESISVKVNLTNADEIQNLFDIVMNTYGHIDVLVNNAGLFDKYNHLLETSDELWDLVFDINVKAIFRLCKLILPQMIERHSGSIVNIASISGLVGSKGGAAYTASKHAVIGLTKHLSASYAKEGIKINAVCPGTIVTPLIKDSVDSIPKDNIPMRRFGTPEEIAELVLFLASEKASFMNGAIIPIDGGYTVH